MWLFSRVSVLLFIAIIYHTNGVLSSGFFTFFQAPGRRMSITFKFRKKGVFLRCEIRAIYEIIGGDIPRKQYYLAKQLPSLSLINCHN